MITKDQIDSTLHFNLGGVYGKLKKWKEAIKHLNIFLANEKLKLISNEDDKTMTSAICRISIDWMTMICDENY